MKKAAVKTGKIAPRCLAITGIKDGEKKMWDSFRACELELGAGHGTVSQFFQGKLKSVKGWILYKKGEEPEAVKSTKTKDMISAHSRKKPVLQFSEGKKVKKWSSLTEAAKGTGIPHSSISKSISGTYQSAGGYMWKFAEAAA